MTTDYDEDIFDNSDEEQVERQWRILQAIRRSSGVTKQELVWERKVSERTFERYPNLITNGISDFRRN